MAQDLLTRAIEGAAAGVAGTVVLQGMVMANQQLLPKTEPPESEDPATFMLWQAEKHLPRKAWMKVPAKAETAAGFGLSIGYGAAFGALYGAIREEGGSSLAEGAVFGLAVWAIGYLGWLPAAGLIPPIHKQMPVQMVGPLVEHITYGVVTVATYNWAAKKW